jgi:HD-GYP domain-containing protein (c-di-GMP phosphodiesterase class II)
MEKKEHKKVEVERLKIGMYVTELDRPWLESPFLFQGFPIRNQDELKQLRESCVFVYIDVEQSIEWEKHESGAKSQDEVRFSTRGVNRGSNPRKKVVYQDQQSFSQTLPESVLLYSAAKDYIGNVLDDVRLGKSINTGAARELTDRLAENIVKNENALVWLTQLKNRDEYTSMHSINVCVLSLLFGRFLGLTEQELRYLGLGALLHDVGKMRIPANILNKPGRLDSNEETLMRRHPEFGYALLKSHDDIHPAVLEIALSHHERYDGSGYPRGLKGKGVNSYALIVSVIDFYDAVTSDRAYHIGISPHEALNMMYAVAAKSFPKELVESFIQCLGIYPIGSLVELESGEVGVVMTVNRERRLNPILTLVLDGKKRPLQVVKMMNLELQERCDSPTRIKRILESNAYGIDVRQLILQSNMTAPAAMV